MSLPGKYGAYNGIFQDYLRRLRKGRRTQFQLGQKLYKKRAEFPESVWRLFEPVYARYVDIDIDLFAYEPTVGFAYYREQYERFGQDIAERVYYGDAPVVTRKQGDSWIFVDRSSKEAPQEEETEPEADEYVYTKEVESPCDQSKNESLPPQPALEENFCLPNCGEPHVEHSEGDIQESCSEKEVVPSMDTNSYVDTGQAFRHDDQGIDMPISGAEANSPICGDHVCCKGPIYDEYGDGSNINKFCTQESNSIESLVFKDLNQQVVYDSACQFLAANACTMHYDMVVGDKADLYSIPSVRMQLKILLCQTATKRHGGLSGIPYEQPFLNFQVLDAKHLCSRFGGSRERESHAVNVKTSRLGVKHWWPPPWPYEG